METEEQLLARLNSYSKEELIKLIVDLKKQDSHRLDMFAGLVVEHDELNTKYNNLLSKLN